MLTTDTNFHFERFTNQLRKKKHGLQDEGTERAKKV